MLALQGSSKTEKFLWKNLCWPIETDTHLNANWRIIQNKFPESNSDLLCSVYPIHPFSIRLILKRRKLTKLISQFEWDNLNGTLHKDRIVPSFTKYPEGRSRKSPPDPRKHIDQKSRLPWRSQESLRVKIWNLLYEVWNRTLNKTKPKLVLSDWVRSAAPYILFINPALPEMCSGVSASNPASNTHSFCHKRSMQIYCMLFPR